MDFLQLLTSCGYEYVLTVVSLFPGLPEDFHCHKATALTVARKQTLGFPLGNAHLFVLNRGTPAETCKTM